MNGKNVKKKIAHLTATFTDDSSSENDMTVEKKKGTTELE